MRQMLNNRRQSRRLKKKQIPEPAIHRRARWTWSVGESKRCGWVSCSVWVPRRPERYGAL